MRYHSYTSVPGVFSSCHDFLLFNIFFILQHFIIKNVSKNYSSRTIPSDIMRHFVSLQRRLFSVFQSLSDEGPCSVKTRRFIPVDPFLAAYTESWPVLNTVHQCPAGCEEGIVLLLLLLLEKTNLSCRMQASRTGNSQ